MGTLFVNLTGALTGLCAVGHGCSWKLKGEDSNQSLRKNKGRRRRPQPMPATEIAGNRPGSTKFAEQFAPRNPLLDRRSVPLTHIGVIELCHRGPR